MEAVGAGVDCADEVAVGAGVAAGFTGAEPKGIPMTRLYVSCNLGSSVAVFFGSIGSILIVVLFTCFCQEIFFLRGRQCILNSMKIVVTHGSPDLDAIAAVWLIKKFLPGWENAGLEFVPAGERSSKFKVSREARSSGQSSKLEGPIEIFDEDEVIHVDTGFGPLDHHQTPDESISAASLTWEYIQDQRSKNKDQNIEKWEDKAVAVDRMVGVVVNVDHFKEIFWADPLAYYHDFSLVGILDGLKLEKQNDDKFYIEFVSQCLDAVLHEFENKIWAEKEIAEKGKEFETRWGKGLGIETVNDSVIKLSQKMGYVVVARKDPRKSYIRIKARPMEDKQIDLTLAYEKFKKMDPNATWFLHVSKKMLLNGSTKNPSMRPTTLSLEEIMGVLEKV